MADVFILGAGFSKAISDSMPVLCELNGPVDKELEGRQIRIERVFPDDIEMELSHLAMGHPWASEADNLRLRAHFLDMAGVVRDVLIERSKDATHKPPCDWLLKLIRWWDRKGSVIITFNYDTLVERGRIQAYHPDGGSGISGKEDTDPLPEFEPHYLYPISLAPVPVHDVANSQIEFAPARAWFQLLKLHGSLNWFYSGQSLSAGETIYYVGPYMWRHSVVANVQERTYKDEFEDKQMKWASTMQPLIVPPLAEKSAHFQHNVIRGIWGNAANALRAADRVFCLGYSLPATDTMVRFLLQSSHPVNDTPFYIVNKQSEGQKVACHFREMLPSCYQIDGRYISTVDDDAPIPRLVRDLVAGAVK